MTNLPLLLFLFFFLLVLSFLCKNGYCRLESFAKALNSKWRYVFFVVDGGWNFRGTMEGRKFSITFPQTNLNDIIEVEHSVPFMMWIYSVSNFPGWFDSMTSSKKELIKTGDPTFDDVLQVYSNQVEQVIEYLSNQTTRETILSLFSLGYHGLMFDIKRAQLLKARKSFTFFQPFDELSADNAKAITSVIKKLMSLPCLESESLNAETVARYNADTVNFGSLSILFVIVGCFTLLISGIAILLGSFTFWRAFFFLGGLGLLAFGIWIAWYCEKIKVGR